MASHACASCQSLMCVRYVARCIFALLALSLTLGTLGSAEEPQPVEQLSAEEVKSQIAKKGAEIKELEESSEAPDAWKELSQIESKLFKLKYSDEEQLLRSRQRELKEHPQAVAWTNRLERIRRNLNQLERQDRKLTLDEGIVLFARRHNDLERLSRANYSNLRSLGFGVLDFPHIDGSTSTQPLATLIACRYFGASTKWVGRDRDLNANRYASEMAPPTFFFLIHTCRDPSPKPCSRSSPCARLPSSGVTKDWRRSSTTC
jgi:hypothetical protein